jgi:integrase
MTAVPRYFRKLSEKLSNGFDGKRGKHILPNNFHDYNRFIESMLGRGLRFRTVRRQLFYLHHFHAEVSPDTLTNFTDHIIVDQPKKDSTAETIRRRNYFVFVALKNYLSAINKREWLKYLPDTREIAKPSSPLKKAQITDAQYKKILDAVDDEQTALFIRVLHDTGMRLTEILMLQPSWIDFSKIPVEISIPDAISKNRKGGVCYITHKTADSLKRYIKKYFSVDDAGIKQCKQCVFWFTDKPRWIEKEGKIAWHDKTLNDLYTEFWLVTLKLKKICDDTGLKGVSPHWFRHTFCKNLQKKGFLPSEIQRLMRHSSLLATDRYLGLSQEEIAKKYNERFN